MCKSEPGLGRAAPALHRVRQRLVVTLRLIGVGGCERGDRLVGGVGFPEAGGDRDPIA
jgi:hypothetical protein